MGWNITKYLKKIFFQVNNYYVYQMGMCISWIFINTAF